jgi:hypothetical protein
MECIIIYLIIKFKKRVAQNVLYFCIFLAFSLWCSLECPVLVTIPIAANRGTTLLELVKARRRVPVRQGPMFAFVYKLRAQALFRGGCFPIEICHSGKRKVMSSTFASHRVLPQRDMFHPDNPQHLQNLQRANCRNLLTWRSGGVRWCRGSNCHPTRP